MRPLVPLMSSIGKRYITRLTIARDSTFYVFFNEYEAKNYDATYYESISWSKRKIIVDSPPQEDLPEGVVSDGTEKDTVIGSGYQYYINYDTHIGH